MRGYPNWLLFRAEPKMSDTFWMIGGPVIFSIIAFLLYKKYEGKLVPTTTKRNN